MIQVATQTSNRELDFDFTLNDSDNGISSPLFTSELIRIGKSGGHWSPDWIDRMDYSRQESTIMILRWHILGQLHWEKRWECWMNSISEWLRWSRSVDFSEIPSRVSIDLMECHIHERSADHTFKDRYVEKNVESYGWIQSASRYGEVEVTTPPRCLQEYFEIVFDFVNEMTPSSSSRKCHLQSQQVTVQIEDIPTCWDRVTEKSESRDSWESDSVKISSTSRKSMTWTNVQLE